MTLMIVIFGTVVSLLFLAFSVFCGVFMLKTRHNIMQTMHWTMKMMWWYGLVFLMMLVITVMGSLIVGGAYIIARGLSLV